MSGWDNNTWDIQDWYKEALMDRPVAPDLVSRAVCDPPPAAR